MHALIAELEQRLAVPRHRYLVVGSAKRHETAKTVLYGFRPRSRWPDFVVKAPYGDNGTDRLGRAWDNLGRIGEALGATPLGAAIPRPLFFGEIAGRTVLAESFVAGRVLATVRGRRARRAACHAVFAWLAGLARATGSDEAPAALPVEVPERLRRYVEGALASLDGIGAVFTHNDLNLRNVVLTREGIGLIDWEFATPRGCPLVDGIDFALSVLMTFGRQDLADAFRRLVAPRDRLARWLRGELRGLAAASDVAPHRIEPLFVRFFLNELAITTARTQGALDALDALSRGALRPVHAELAA